MIVDAILDRKDGHPYDEDVLKYMYDEAIHFRFWNLARAIDSGTEKDIKRELCNYIDDNDYNPAIKKYINKVDWLCID